MRRSLPSARLTILIVGFVLCGLAGIGVLGLLRASGAGTAGKVHLAQAEQDLLAQRIGLTRLDLMAAQSDFGRMRNDLHSPVVGSVLAFWRVVPLVRVQVRAVDTFAGIGSSLSHAGLVVTDATATLQNTAGSAVPLSASLDKLRTAQRSLHGAVAVLDNATSRLRGLDHYLLLGPIGSAHAEASRRVVRIDRSARSAEQALTALIAFTGGNGPREYLILSQNPDEVRPTGGFIGSYGVLNSDAGRVRLDRYDDIGTWLVAHPDAIIPADQLGSPFRFYDPPLDQSFANVNATPDWPQAAALAVKLWQQGGEAPADGVVSFTPRFLARILAVVGPVAVPGYNETVTSANVVDKLDYYTHVLPPPAGSNRKDFLSPVGQAIVSKLLDAPSAQWRALGSAVGAALTARELLVWSTDHVVQSTLSQRGTDGAFPATSGDFFFDSEFEYGAKNGRGLKRTFADEVALQADGSGQVTTTITIDNTEEPSPVNLNILSYYTVYGPAGAALDPSSDAPFSPEPTLAGHPAAGWFRAIDGHGTGTIKVVWNVPNLAERRSDGSWQYSLRWQHIVDNTSDLLNLKVVLPPGGRWQGPAPPSRSALDHDVAGQWVYRISG